MLKRFPVEAAIWFAGLLFFAASDPAAPHFTVCALKNIGLDFCPGCGLGQSITLMFRGQFAESISVHPLGIIAVIILSFRIINLTKHYLQHYGKSY